MSELIGLPKINTRTNCHNSFLYTDWVFLESGGTVVYMLIETENVNYSSVNAAKKQ